MNNISPLVKVFATLALVALLLIVVVLVAIFVPANWNIPRKLFDNYVLDNSVNYLPCDAQVKISELEEFLSKNEDLVKKVESIGTNVIVQVGDAYGNYCPETAKLVFFYGSHKERQEVEKLINNSEFSKYPYDLVNW